MNFIDIEFVNWERHQPRKDIKHPSWFAVQNRILEDAKLFDLTDAEWKCFLYLLCQASQQNSACVKINLAHAKRVCGILESIVKSTISKLTYANVTCTYGSVRATYANVTRHYTTDTTEQTIQTPASTSLRSDFDFLKLYEKYPRKIGKQKGLRKCKLEIKTADDYEKLSLAIDRYVAKINQDKTEARFIKHFCTFMADWRDWTDPETGSVVNVAKTESGGWEFLDGIR